MTHDNVRDALNYAADLLEQIDAGGTLPGRLRQIADVHDDLLAACELALALWYEDNSRGPGTEEDGQVAKLLNEAIAAARPVTEKIERSV